MTREELKEHCERRVKAYEMWASDKGEKPSGQAYEEHKLILELLEQEDVLDKITAEINAHKEELKTMADTDDWYAGKIRGYDCAIEIIDKYKESEEQINYEP